MTDYAALTVVNLKILLDQRSLAKTGKKAELVQRLEEDDAQKAQEPHGNAEQGSTSSADPSMEPVLEAPTLNTDDAPDYEETKPVDSKSAAPMESPKGLALKADSPITQTTDPQMTQQVEAPDAQDLSRINEPDATSKGDATTQKDLKRATIDPDVGLPTKRPRTEELTKTVAEPEDPAILQTTDVSPSSEVLVNEDRVSPRDPTEVQKHKVRHQAGAALPRHFVTDVLYIENLVRPIHEDELRKHLEHTSQQTVDLYLNALKTHAFVRFETKDGAKEVREFLHGEVWPKEAGRRPLNVDYMKSEEMSAFIKREEAHPKSTRWHIIYEDGVDGVSLKHEQVQTGEALPAVHTHDRGLATRERRKVLKLDELFKKTRSKPALFYLPRQVYN